MADHIPERYPLEWPAGWPRSRRAERSKFADVTLYAARAQLERELRLLGATSVVLSSNIPLRQDGLPYSNTREPSDHGAAVYFRLKGHPRVLACDKWDRVAHNIVAVAKHIEATRGQSRWGVGSVEQAFAGYQALPAVPSKRPWWVVLGVPESATWLTIQKARVELLMRHHPDRGGDPSAAAEVNAAYEEAQVARRSV